MKAMTDGPFHAGELEAQMRAGQSSGGAGIRGFMPDQHRLFFTQLPWLFLGVLDAQGWPLATVLTGAPGFVESPSPTSLAIRALPQEQDPAAGSIRPGAPVGLLGIAFETRRRNRANGTVGTAHHDGFDVTVAQSFGNCAKYIQTRTVERSTEPRSVRSEELTSLDAAARGLIASADTFFVASSAGQDAGPAGGADISHRGGQPGFVRIDGDTLTVPDFAGNSYFNTLGNLLREPRAALLFVDFRARSVLQLQGSAEILWSDAEAGRLDGAERLWRLHVTRGWRREQALPLRWSAPGYAPTTLQTGAWNRPVLAPAG
jgi:predicted pyridoxine 5'-phosphate oxidase superfamily flavin-nucleotide-binding protein